MSYLFSFFTSISSKTWDTIAIISLRWANLPCLRMNFLFEIANKKPIWMPSWWIMCLIILADMIFGQKQDITLKKLFWFIFVAGKVGKVNLKLFWIMIGSWKNVQYFPSKWSQRGIRIWDMAKEVSVTVCPFPSWSRLISFLYNMPLYYKYWNIEIILTSYSVKYSHYIVLRPE